MKITDVQAFLLSYPMPEPVRLPFYGGERTIYKRDAAFVRVATDGGLVGYGPVPGSETTVQHINGTIRDALLGEDPTPIGTLRDKIHAVGSPALSLAFGPVEIALYDLRGKMEGCPVYDLLGGKARDRVRLYGSAGMYQSPEGYAAEAAAIMDLGFTAYKMRPALGPEDDVKTVRLMREATRPDFGLMIDAHAWWRMGDLSYTPETIEQMAREMAAYQITWLEEPLPPQDRAAYVRLREKNIVTVAAGEHETSFDGLAEIVTCGAVDIAQGDPAHQGGYTPLRKTLDVCAEYRREFAFHNWGTLLECIASAHLGICYPQEVMAWLEYPCYRHRGQDIMYPYVLADEILTEPLHIEQGDLLLSDAPGLGVQIDESVVERYPYLPGPWSIMRLKSPEQVFHFSGDHSLVWEEDK